MLDKLEPVLKPEQTAAESTAPRETRGAAITASAKYSCWGIPANGDSADEWRRSEAAPMSISM
jgi:hypothetical protein